MASLEDLHAELVAGDLRAASKIVERALLTMLSLARQQVPKPSQPQGRPFDLRL